MMKADLHMHTTCSDGLHTPSELTAMAAAAKLDVIAISDHDTMAAYDGTHRLHDGVKIISAIEMSSDCADEDVHILGYHLDPANEELQDYCRDFKERRAVRARKIVEKCTALGYALDLTVVNDILRRGGTVGRPHIAAMLVEKGYFSSVSAVFERILSRNGPAYVPYDRYDIDACIEIIHRAGGLSFLAHPSLLKAALPQVLQHPFDGIEVYHPKNRGRYDEFLGIAREKDWLVSGGSDYHGTIGRYPDGLGVFSFDAAPLQPLLSYKG